jgi:cell division protein FtsB
VRVVIALLLIVTLYLHYALWFTRGGIRDVHKLEQALAEAEAEVADLRERNRALAAEVMDLKQGLDAIEERARSEMGKIKAGEIFFRLTETPAEAGPPASAPAAPVPPR